MTKWTKLDTSWTGVSVDTLLDGVDLGGDYVTIWSDGGYTTNLAIADITGGKAWVVDTFDGRAARARARWPGASAGARTCTSGRARSGCADSTVTPTDEPGFWEQNGYHNHGDPWREQRYWSD